MAKRQGEEFWRKHLEAWGQSGLTQVAYCERHGLSEKSFYRWRRKEAGGLARSLTLVPVSVTMPEAEGVVRLHSPGGWRIEIPGHSGPWLVELLRQLP